MRRFVSDESGLAKVDYAIIAGLIVISTVTTILAVGLWVSAKFDALEAALDR